MSLSTILLSPISQIRKLRLREMVKDLDTNHTLGRARILTRSCLRHHPLNPRLNRIPFPAVPLLWVTLGRSFCWTLAQTMESRGRDNTCFPTGHCLLSLFHTLLCSSFYSGLPCTSLKPEAAHRLTEACYLEFPSPAQGFICSVPSCFIYTLDFEGP